MHEAKASFQSVVDPFALGDIYLSTAYNDGEFSLELEEADLTTLSLPFRS